MKSKEKESWKIFNHFYKEGMWFWATVIVGAILFCAVLYVLAEYSIMWVK